MMNKNELSVSINDLIPIIESSLKSGGSVEITVPGNSMKPFLLDRISRVKLTAVDGVKKGDVVLYRRENGVYVLHRVVAENNGTYTMCGDNQSVLEEGIKPSQIIAKAAAFSRKNRWFNADNIFYTIWWKTHIFNLPIRRKIRYLLNK